MFLKNILLGIPVSIVVFLFYATIYGFIADRSLGREYKMFCFEPGCIISGNRNSIMSDIEEYSITEQYIIGRVGEPNNWVKERIKEKDMDESIEGYFIIDKYKHTQKIKMTEEEFLQECTQNNIEDCNLNYGSMIDPTLHMIRITGI